MEVVKLAAPYAAVLLENIMYAAPVLAMRKAARVGRLQIDPTRFAASASSTPPPSVAPPPLSFLAWSIADTLKETRFDFE